MPVNRVLRIWFWYPDIDFDAWEQFDGAPRASHEFIDLTPYADWRVDFRRQIYEEAQRFAAETYEARFYKPPGPSLEALVAEIVSKPIKRTWREELRRNRLWLLLQAFLLLTLAITIFYPR